MSHKVTYIVPQSPAWRAGMMVGDRLVSVDGEPIVDFIDYEALTAERRIRVQVRRDREDLTFDIRKGEYEALGLCFDRPMMSNMRWCVNHCLFCFVDQLPPNARDTMRVKDDDWRTSLMMGSYVTLTNVTDRELQRIIRRHASPLYISVHCTDPVLRTRVLGTRRAAGLMDQLKTLSEGGIQFHCQCVLCPGINDGAALERTIEDLSAIPGARSLALVPVGLTGHRVGLYDLHPYTRDEAREVIDIAERWRQRLLKAMGTRFVFPSDEFYLQADAPIPPDEAYEGYEQIDDGVGLLRLLDTEYIEAWEGAGEAVVHSDRTVHLAIACGKSAEAFLRDMLSRYPVAGAQIDVYGLENTWFGPTVTVSGLITGRDLMGQMMNVPCDAVMITEVMLKENDNRFLDDTTLPQVIEALGRPVVPVGRRGEDLLDAILRLRDGRAFSVS